ncbi:MAG: HAMP domain-containing protein [bacterium]
MSNSSSKSQRKTVIIKESFQWRWIMKPVLILLFGLTVVSAALAYLLDYSVGSSFEQYFQNVRTTRELIMPALLGSSVTIFFVGSGLIIWQFRKLTHRIAGPMYRLEQSFKELEEGNLDLQITFREKDEFQELTDYFNDSVRSTGLRVHRALKSLNEIDSDQLSDDDRELLQDARSALNEFELDSYESSSSG